MTESNILEEQDPGCKSVAKKAEEKDTEKDGGYALMPAPRTSQFCTGPVLSVLQGQEAKHIGLFLTGGVGELNPSKRPMVCLAVSWDFSGRKQEG